MAHGDGNADLGSGGTLSGAFVRGEYLGKKLGDTWTRPDGTSAHSRPALGIRVEGLGDLSVVVANDGEALAFGREHAAGELVEVMVIVRPPYGSTGRVAWFTPDGWAGVGRGGGWS